MVKYGLWGWWLQIFLLAIIIDLAFLVLLGPQINDLLDPTYATEERAKEACLRVGFQGLEWSIESKTWYCTNATAAVPLVTTGRDQSVW